MMKEFFKTIEVTSSTESGIQIAKPKIVIPKASVSSTNSGIIIPKSSGELLDTIAFGKIFVEKL